jgi:microcystin-dependent protein
VFIFQETNPIGMVVAFGGTVAPAGWLLCDGAEVSRRTQDELFDVIGENYGAGNGETTFNIPDMRGRYPQGKDPGDPVFDTLGLAGGEKEVVIAVDQLPVHMHVLEGRGSGDQNRPINSGGPTSSLGTAFTGTITPGETPEGVSSNVGSDADEISPNNPHDNMSPHQIANYIIAL